MTALMDDGMDISNHGEVRYVSVEVQWQSPRGDTIHRTRSKPKSGSIVLGRGPKGDLAIAVLYGNEHETVFSVKGGVSLHGKFIPEGKACVKLVGQRVQILLSRGDPDSLQARKEEGKREEGSKENKVPYHLQPLRSKLYRAPEEVKRISPLSVREQARCPQLKRDRDSDSNNSEPLSEAKKNKLLTCLSAEQRAVFDAVLSGQNVFFTGKAGTGKSFLLQTLIQALPTQGTVITASTGVAACNISGTTLHSFAGFKAGSGKLPRHTNQWRAAKRIIIDEISMVDGTWFDELERVARKVRGCEKPFGGIQIIMCGDFLQLPPVSTGGEMKSFAFAAKCWSKVVTTLIHLQEVHRQKDQDFVDLLGRVRIGKCTSDDVKMLRETAAHSVAGDGVVATRLCSHVADAKDTNERSLQALSGKARAFVARDDYGHDPAMLRLLNNACRAPQVVELKPGAQVMLLKNIDLKRNLANGSRGVVESFTPNGHPVVRFLSGESLTVHPEPWTLNAGNNRILSRRQIPLQLAWGISIHKSQGMTLDAVEVDLSKCFEYGQAYVALSRARTLGGLCVKRFSASCVKAHPAVIRFYDDFE